MSNRELAKSLIDQMPEGKLIYIVAYLQGALIPDNLLGNEPNEETIAGIEELESGGGTLFTGSTTDLFTQLMEN